MSWGSRKLRLAMLFVSVAVLGGWMVSLWVRRSGEIDDRVACALNMRGGGSGVESLCEQAWGFLAGGY